MKFIQAIVLALPALAAAYPSMMGASSRAEIEDYIHSEIKREEIETCEAKPQLLNPVSTFLSALEDTVSGLMKSVGNAIVVQSNKRPEPGYTSQAPGPNYSRGPCPGLNLLANYGYLPRDGYVNMGQVLEATSRGFNMDYYNGCGDNHHLSSRLVKQMMNFANDDPNKEFSLNVMAQHYARNAAFSKDYNPYLYYFPVPQIVSLGAFAFYPNFFSNGTYNAGGVANYRSIMSIIGAEYDEGTGEFKYVPERWPENWYRRATPYGAVQALTEAFTLIYTRNIIVPGIAQVGTPDLSIEAFLCDVYQGINSITPLVLGGTLGKTSKAVTWALGVLDPILNKTALGCPDNVLSPNLLFPESQREGGPVVPPRVPSDANTGDNVYNKIYFKDEPKERQCSQ